MKYFYFIHKWDPITPSQQEPMSNGNGMVLLIPQSSRAGASSSEDLVSYPRQLCGDFYAHVCISIFHM